MSVMVGIFSRMYYSNMKVWDSVCVCVCVCVYPGSEREVGKHILEKDT